MNFSFSSVSQKEALLNEVKGYLFEYLVAKNLALHWNIGASFIKGVPKEFTKRLSDYESWLRDSDAILLQMLPLLTEHTTREIMNYFDRIDPNKKFNPVEVILAGKASTSNGSNVWQESDIIIKDANCGHGLSLKLCKSNSYVNTKSGGMGSFLTSYFGDFEEASYMQDLWLSYAKERFQMMAYDLHELADVEPEDHFADVWKKAKLPKLPGELKPSMKERLHLYYHEVAHKLYDFLNELFERNKNKFCDCLLSLLGHTKEDVVKVICYYQNNKNQRYLFDRVDITDQESVLSLIEEVQMSLPTNTASVDFKIGKVKPCFLQIRLKPMNSFHQFSMKVNCSLKEIK